MIASFLAALVLATPCSASQTRATVASFVSAYNAGDTVTLDTLFAPEPDFKWYSANPPGARIHEAAFKRGTLMRYFATRRARGDRLRLLGFSFNSAARGLGNFTLVLKRRAGDYRGGGWFKIVGKGAISCTLEPQSFVVMSLGGPRP